MSPTRSNADGSPVVEFDPRIEISPFAVFRRLADGEPLDLVDVREGPIQLTLKGSRTFDGEWRPPADRDAVLFDDDGLRAFRLAQGFQEQGHPRVRALFGGLDLYEFSLDPEVVGGETFLERLTG